jgi:hypothetical protein
MNVNNRLSHDFLSQLGTKFEATFFFYFNDNECDAQLLVNAHIFLATKWNSKAAVMFDSDVNTVQVRLI